MLYVMLCYVTMVDGGTYIV